MEEEIAAAMEIIETGYNNLVTVLKEETILLNRRNWAVCQDAEGNKAFLNIATGDLLLNGDVKVLWQQQHSNEQQSNTRKIM